MIIGVIFQHRFLRQKFSNKVKFRQKYFLSNPFGPGFEILAAAKKRFSWIIVFVRRSRVVGYCTWRGWGRNNQLLMRIGRWRILRGSAVFERCDVGRGAGFWFRRKDCRIGLRLLLQVRNYLKAFKEAIVLRLEAFRKDSNVVRCRPRALGLASIRCRKYSARSNCSGRKCPVRFRFRQRYERRQKASRGRIRTFGRLCRCDPCPKSNSNGD